MTRVSLTPAVFHLPPEVGAVAGPYAAQPIVPRGPGLAPVLAGLQARLPAALGCDPETWAPVLLTASGSGALAAALARAVDGRGILVVSNGAYGERQARFAAQLGKRIVHMQLPYGARPDAEAIAARAQAEGVGAIGMVHGATSTCSVNPIAEVGAVSQGLGLRFVVDAIASVFVEDFDPEACHVDVLVASVNKGLHSHPDLSFVLARRTLLTTWAESDATTAYLDLGETWRAQRDGGHPYTINVRALLEVGAALDALQREGGVAGRIATYRARAALLREGYAELGLQRFERPGMPLQNIGTALMLPEDVPYGALADALADYAGPEQYDIYSAQGPLSGEVFRVFHMGHYPLETYRRFLDALRDVLGRLRA